jgi:hypothetical protein
MTLKSRLTHLEAQHAATETEVQPYVPPMPSLAWWEEFWGLIETSPWRAQVLATLEGLPDAPTDQA